MEAKRLMKVTYQDLKKGIRLNAYADAVIWSEDPSPTLAGLRFGGYAEVVRGLTDAIYGGATIEIEDADGSLLTLKSLSKQYHREVSHEGLYAEATLIAEDEIQESSKSQDEKSSKHAQKDDLFDDNVPQQDIPAHICYIFCHPGNEDELFQAIDQKSYVPMIPEYQDYVLAELKRRRILRPLRVRSLYQELEAWKLCCEAKDQNLVKVMEDGLKQGKIKIPGAAPGPSLLDGVHSVTDYPKQLEDLGLDCVILAPSMLELLPERMPAEDGRLLSLTCFYDSDCGCNAQTLALSNDMGLVLRKMREDLDTYEIPVVLSHVERLIDGYRFSYEAKDAGVESLYLSYTISGVPVFLQQPAGHA